MTSNASVIKNEEHRQFVESTILIDDKTENYKCGLRRLDERKLNALLDSVPENVAKTLIARVLPKPDVERLRSNRHGGGHRLREQTNAFDVQNRSKIKVHVNIPKTVTKIINDTKLMDEVDPLARMYIFLGYCRWKRYSYLTVKRYLKIARRHGAFGPDLAQAGSRLPVSPDPTVFTGRLHTRVVSRESYVKLFEFLKSNLSRFYAPILLPFYTALRTREILQFDSCTLHQLQGQQQTVNIKRKQTSPKKHEVLWKPTYIKDFIVLVHQLLDLYKDEYEAYRDNGVSVPLFHVTPKTLNNRIRCAYSMANPGLTAPLGFGIHSCRNMMGSFMAEATKNLHNVQTFLQHSSLKTTSQYIKTNFAFLREQFDRITDQAFSSIISELNSCEMATNDDEKRRGR